ncbi:Replicative DNA helicase [Geodia barretti]|uniref:DNA 5'-3' helicase n=1 Tax=Geodia barretti TaxID=519541 RepID=A0AA35RUX3_GEOBA|nr:Replicative DNA helicase [Geodia barretti]
MPHDPEAEAAVLGALLIDGDALHRVTPLIKPEDFHRARHQFCFAACLAVFTRQEAIDQITVARELQTQGRLEQVGGLPYLGQLIAGTPTSVNVEHYAAIVAETAAKRRIIGAGNRISELGFDESSDVDETMRHSVLDVYLQGDIGDVSLTDEPPLQSGYSDFDSILGGMQRSDLLIVGARPGLGKSSLALNICTNAAKAGQTCGIFSLEMSREQVAMRMLVAESGVDSHRLRLGLLSENEQNVISDAVGLLSGLPIFIDDTPFQTTMDMRSKAQRLQLEHGLDFLVVDYLQLIQGGGRRQGYGENRVQEISEISRSLKGMARDLNAPVFTCSQLSRVVENRPGHRPQLSDLRDSGSIEQDADVVTFLFREDRVFTEEEWEQHAPGRPVPA